MDNLYIFSHNDYDVIFNQELTKINAFLVAEIKNYTNEKITIVEKSSSPVLQAQFLFDNTITKTQNIRVNIIDNNIYCEIIHINDSTPLQKFCIESSEVIIYKNFIKILYKNSYFSYYFYSELDNSVIEKDGIIYIFNKKQLLVFDTKIKSFCLKKCKKYAKNGDKIEILCEIPKNNVYFILYFFDIENKTVSKKLYKNDNILLCDNYTTPIIFFHLLKNNISEAKSLLNNDINFNDIQNYLCQFDEIWEIDGEYFLSSFNNFCKIKFIVKNNLILDVD